MGQYKRHIPYSHGSLDWAADDRLSTATAFVETTTLRVPLDTIALVPAISIRSQQAL